MKSIIYNDKTATDELTPYTFIEYVGFNDIDNSSSSFYSDYNQYLKDWAEFKNNNNEIVSYKELIHRQTVDLLKIITISFTSFEEQVFLANLQWDYDNLSDENVKQQAKNEIYSALPLFVKKIKEVAFFYKDQRNEATFTIERNKIKGTQTSLEKIIYDNIITYLFNNEPTKLKYVQAYLNISIENYIDTYSEYFDLDKSKSDPCDYNNIDKDIYFEVETVISSMLFDGYVYLREIQIGIAHV